MDTKLSDKTKKNDKGCKVKEFLDWCEKDKQVQVVYVII